MLFFSEAPKQPIQFNLKLHTETGCTFENRTDDAQMPCPSLSDKDIQNAISETKTRNTRCSLVCFLFNLHGSVTQRQIECTKRIRKGFAEIKACFFPNE